MNDFKKIVYVNKPHLEALADKRYEPLLLPDASFFAMPYFNSVLSQFGRKSKIVERDLLFSKFIEFGLYVNDSGYRQGPLRIILDNLLRDTSEREYTKELADALVYCDPREENLELYARSLPEYEHNASQAQAQALFKAGMVHLKIGKTRDALNYLDEAIDLYPDPKFYHLKEQVSEVTSTLQIPGIPIYSQQTK